MGISLIVSLFFIILALSKSLVTSLVKIPTKTRKGGQWKGGREAGRET